VKVLGVHQVYVGVYDFVSGSQDDNLLFKKGDLLAILDKHEEAWWKAQHLATLAVGVIPCTYVSLYKVQL
jgi:hypothetical protein